MRSSQAMTERMLPNVEIIDPRPRSAIIPRRKSERTLQRAPASQDDLPATSSVYRGPGLLGLPGTLRSRCCSLDWLLEVAPWFGLACANTKFVLSSMRMAAMPAIFFIAVPLFLIATRFAPTLYVLLRSFLAAAICSALPCVPFWGRPANRRGIRVKS
jgi:hypothetical protein